MQRICPSCERPIKEGEHVRAVILSVLHELKSKVVYSLEKPYDCEEIKHINCQYPTNEFGELDGD